MGLIGVVVIGVRRKESQENSNSWRLVIDGPADGHRLLRPPANPRRSFQHEHSDGDRSDDQFHSLHEFQVDRQLETDI
jgi:hypothetical protein